METLVAIAIALLVPSLGALIWLVRAVREIQVVLVGINGDNGLQSEVKLISKWKHNVVAPLLQALEIWKDNIESGRIRMPCSNHHMED
jgi:hypothetical protein